MAQVRDAGVTPVLLNLCLIFAALFVGPHMAQPIYAQAWGVLVGGILQLLIQVPALRRLGAMPRLSFSMREAWTNAGVRRILRQMGPRCSPCRSRKSA